MEKFIQPKSIEIENHNHAMVEFKDLNLNVESPDSAEIKVVVEKQPITINEGKSYGNYSVLIDTETPKIHELVMQAESIKELPELERPRALLNLLLDSVQYAHNDTVVRLAETNPDLAEWVSKNTGLDSYRTSNVPLSLLFEKGYGVCRHLSVAFLYLAQKAGLEGCLMNCVEGTIKNIEKYNSKDRLFKSAEIGNPVSAHTWAEIKLGDGRWIPVDPSTNLVGDTPETFNMFRQANYIAIGYGLDIESDKSELSIVGTGISFRPGETKAEGCYHLFLKSTQPKLTFSVAKGSTSVPATNIPFSGDAKMLISTGDDAFGMKLSLVEVL